MPIEFKLPEVSEGVTSVDVAEVLVSKGDVIKSGDIICEVETDKAVAEISCPHAGRIADVLVASGQTIQIGQPLVLIEAEDDDAETTAPSTGESSDEAAESESADGESAGTNGTGDKPSASSKSGSQTSSQDRPAEAPAAAADSDRSDTGKERVIEFRLPEVSEGVNTVDVASVSVSPGDVIEANSIVCEVETEKAVAEIHCPYAGTIESVEMTAGNTIEIGSPLLTIRTTASAAKEKGEDSGPQKKSQSESTLKPATGKSGETSPAANGSRQVSGAPAQPQRIPDQSGEATGHSGEATGHSGEADGRPPVPAGPATRRLARKLGVDLRQVRGSADGGRIVIEDVETYVRERLGQSTVPGAASGPGFGNVAVSPLPDFSKFGPIDRQPMNKIFRTAAANLHAAWVTIPHVTQHDLADITELESARKRYVKSNPQAPRITMTAIMIKAVVSALKAFPNVNSSVDMEASELVLKNYFHIGVAVDTPNGLVVPVIRNCDQKNVLQVAAELTDVAERARERRLKAEDMQGGTFTITNLGGIGGTAFTPIVNYPEVAILGMSRSQQQLVIEDGQITERLMLPLSLSYDHRAINGADAARFVVKLSSSLSNFFELF